MFAYEPTEFHKLSGVVIRVALVDEKTEETVTTGEPPPGKDWREYERFEFDDEKYTAWRRSADHLYMEFFYQPREFEDWMKFPEQLRQKRYREELAKRSQLTLIRGDKEDEKR